MRFFSFAVRRIGVGAACLATLLLATGPVQAQQPVATATRGAGPEQAYGWPWLVRALDRLKPETDTRIPETPTEVAQRLETMIDNGQSAAALEEIAALQKKRAASTISGVDARLLFLQARAFASQSDISRAINIYRGMTVNFPELPEPWNNLAVLYASQGRLDEAREALETALLVDPGYAAAKANLGDVYLMLAARSHREASEQGVATSRTVKQHIDQLLK